MHSLLYAENVSMNCDLLISIKREINKLNLLMKFYCKKKIKTPNILSLLEKTKR